MTHEFDHVRAVFASSGVARALAIARERAKSGWRSSAFRGASRKVTAGMTRSSRSVLIRTAAVAIAVAGAIQPLLMWLMPPTVRPAMPPYVFVVIALVAIAAAWRPGDVAAAWPSSHVARWLRQRG